MSDVDAALATFSNFDNERKPMEAAAPNVKGMPEDKTRK